MTPGVTNRKKIYVPEIGTNLPSTYVRQVTRETCNIN